MWAILSSHKQTVILQINNERCGFTKLYYSRLVEVLLLDASEEDDVDKQTDQ